MTEKQLEGTPGASPTLPIEMPTDWKQVKFAPPTDEDMNLLSGLRSGSEPWKMRGETHAESLEALTKLEKGRDLNRHLAIVHDLEHQADGLSRAAIGRLFKGGLDPLEVIKLRDLYKTLEETIDAAEDAAEVIERILAKS